MVSLVCKYWLRRTIFTQIAPISAQIITKKSQSRVPLEGVIKFFIRNEKFFHLFDAVFGNVERLIFRSSIFFLLGFCLCRSAIKRLSVKLLLGENIFCVFSRFCIFFYICGQLKIINKEQ